MKLAISLAVLLLVAASASAGEDEPENYEAITGYKTTKLTVTEGKGTRVVKRGDKVTVHATGIVMETDKKFWSTKDAGQQPFTYNAGVGGVITGWDQGCLGMKLGEVRKLIIPADEGTWRRVDVQAVLRCVCVCIC